MVRKKLKPYIATHDLIKNQQDVLDIEGKVMS